MKRHYFRRRPSSSTKKKTFFKNKNYHLFFFLRQLYDIKFQGALLYCIILSNFSVEVVQSIETFGHCSPVFGTQTRTTHHDENGAIFSYKKEKKSLLKTLFTKATKGFRFKRSLFKLLWRHCVDTNQVTA